jgi:hypothetical protein
MHVVYCLVFFLPVLLVLVLRKPNFQDYGGRFTSLALLYAGYAASSTLWSSSPRPLFFAQHFLFLAVWLCGTAWLANRGQLNLDRIYNLLSYTGAIMAPVLFIVCYYPKFGVFEHPLGERFGFIDYGVARHPNTLALIFGITTLLSYMKWLSASGWKSNAWFLALLLINVTPVLASQSRSMVICLPLVLAVGFFLRGTSRWKVFVHILCALLFVSLLFTQRETLTSLIAPRINAPTYREQIWHYTINTTVQEHLLFGSGLVKTTRIAVPGLEQDLPALAHAHNAFIDAFYWTGLVGLLLMSAHLGYLLWHWSRSKELLPLFLWLLFGCLTALVDRPGFFEHLSGHWFVYWIPAGLIGAAISAQWPVESRDFSA